MLCNLHTHTTFCDGKDTPEEMVKCAIDKGFCSLGFSGHGYTPYDQSYCMKDEDGFIGEINRLKDKYRDKIEIYLGSEEDSYSPVDRSKYEYIIGSSHYFHIGDEYLPIDSGYDRFERCLAAFGYDTIRLATAYYSSFCQYINERKPDIVGHFDLITKFDEKYERRFLDNPQYNRIAERYVAEAAKSGSVFEVNTGAIARGYRSTPYPNENLLLVLKEKGARLMLSSDCHSMNALDFQFRETERYLYDLGFRHCYALRGGEFISYRL